MGTDSVFEASNGGGAALCPPDSFSVTSAPRCRPPQTLKESTEVGLGWGLESLCPHGPSLGRGGGLPRT